MSDADSTNGRPSARETERGVIANLPRTRPQRPSARRAASRRATQVRTGTAEAERAAPGAPPAPRQGYEPESDFETGASVQPPSGAELIASVAEIAGELAQAGLSSGGRLLKDALSLLPGL